MKPEEIVKGFNRWLEEQINNPEDFEKTAELIETHLREKNEGKEPTYGERCLACLEKYSNTPPAPKP